MKTKFNGFLTLLLALVVQITFAQEKTITGTVSDETGPLPGVSVIIKGTTSGTETDFDGKYTIQAKPGDILSFSFIGMSAKEVKVGSSNTVNVVMAADNVLEEVVVTALGIKRETRTLTYASQEIKSENLNISQDVNMKSAIAGKVAGVQIQGQAGSKLGEAGKIRIRGAMSLTSDNDPLYVVDGIAIDNPSDVDMNNVASLNVLKGPNATALYGQRADAGVVVITTKKGTTNGIGVELLSSVTFEKVAYLPKFQNEYGQGYDGEASLGTFDGATAAIPEWSSFDGERYIQWDNNYADESWGAKFDGGDYLPWYSFWPDSPYFGQTAKYEAQPDNIKNFYDTGVSLKNSVAVSGGGDNYNARISFTDLDQSGVVPYSKFDKQFVAANFDFDVTDKFNVATTLNYSVSKTQGDFDDGYSNQSSGNFNQWFGRNIDTDKLKELIDLKTPDGYNATWNWWGPDYYAYGGGYKKPAFWFNPYYYAREYKNVDRNNNFAGSVNLTYKFNDNWKLTGGATRTKDEMKNNYYVPYSLQFSAAPELYNSWSNSFGVTRRTRSENNYNAALNYTNKFGDFDVDAFVGGNIRVNNYDRFRAEMDTGAKIGGLIIPDVYTFSNAGIAPSPNTYVSKKEVRSMYGKASFGYKNMLYLDGTYRKDWSSALPENSNGYGYPSVGTSFIFSELIDNNDILTFGKIRAGWAQVGNDLDAYKLDPAYALSDKPYDGISLEYTNTDILDPNIKPAINTSLEVGFDTRFLKNRLGLSFTYYKENRKDEIIPISVSRGTGYDSYLTNAGESERKGVELTLTATPVKSDDFSWDITANFAKNTTTIVSLPGDLKSLEAPGGNDAFGFVYVTHELGSDWGQLRGTAIERDADGNAVLQSNGLYSVETAQYLGSILPEFTGGILNGFSYKNLSLTASIDFQKGGKFFSLSEMWGSSSGLLESTAGNNDKGNPKRDAVADGGGTHVVGVSDTGTPIDMYVETYDYNTQYYSNRLAEPFIHDASYIKLRDVSLTYNFSKKLLNNTLSGASISFIARNLWLISVSKDNTQGWDPSEMSQSYGENGQMPGTRSYGLNVKLTF
ncbi:SusC/RagA family TonB-linked outer membrane protein [Aureibaculum sp. A20]|uniref:SusC/RagA family TonB-linked outer membrane protein n=1 Tax=Aureibaculum flavum TaxID=2795986 RepID=A0ABS0WSW6_9FLAO|nr:SusC/RagA family TonB-linked outer membrane protein [Aureibaculum flavum]MBJ2175039.1 SusC/RagA family TonB-linked outer membrane protein [Aureibaculum flavum]